MTGGQAFIDYYDILQVNPNCDAKILESAYHYLAKLYHPDHSGREDSERFHEVTQAYRVLRDPEQRAEYDRRYAQENKDGGTLKFPSGAEVEIDGKAALDDAEDHTRILLYLYKKRREDAQNAGVVGFYLQELLQCSDERFDFHKWYLKEKGFIVLTEQGTLAITIEGVDHIISMSRTARAEKLLLGQSSGSTTPGSGDAAT
jgi:curved DNA-binding protein